MSDESLSVMWMISSRECGMVGRGEGDDEDMDMALVGTFVGGPEDNSCLDVDATLRARLDLRLEVLEA